MGKDQKSDYLEQKTIWEDLPRMPVTWLESIWREEVDILKAKMGIEWFSLIKRLKDMERFAKICAINEK